MENETVETIIEETPTFRMEIKDGKIFKALSDFQGKAEMPKKTGYNPHYKSKYATLDECITVNQELMQECGLAVMQFPFSEGDKIGIITVLTHIGGEYFRSEYSVKPDKLTPQGLGSAITYLRRYALTAITGTAGDMDDDGNRDEGDKDKPKAKTQKKALTDKELDDGISKCDTKNDLDVMFRNKLTPAQSKTKKIQEKFTKRKVELEKKAEDDKAEVEKETEQTDIVTMMVMSLKNDDTFDRDMPIVEEEIDKCEKEKKDAYLKILQVKLKDIGKSDYVPNVTPF